MSSIFISHSREDNAWAQRIKVWLEQQGYGSLFLDFEPEMGIVGGSDWRKTLYQKLRLSRAVIALCSEHYVTSEWCLSEVAIATDQGKDPIPLQIDPAGELPRLLQHIQAIDFRTNPEQGFQRLAQGLATRLQWKDRLPLDPDRSPYPGLKSFQEIDAPLFFGRDRESEEVVERLRSLCRRGGSLLLLLGASGCGKSSLARAGVVPQLRLDPDSWLVLEPFRPGAEPFEELEAVLAPAFERLGESPPELPRTAEAFRKLLRQLRLRSGRREATVVILIDQLEELLVDGGASASERDAGEADQFLTFLGDLLGHGDGLMLVMATLRSDFLGAFQLRAADLSRLADQVLLGPMQKEGYMQVIEGPAQRVGLHLEPGLSDRMAAETGSGDALPLLAYTLWDLWDKHGKEDGDLTLKEYKLLGGLAKSVERAADRVLAPERRTGEELTDLRSAFLRLARLNEEGGVTRRTALWSELPPACHPVLREFVQERLLISGKQEGTLEVAHEALLRTWPTFQQWLQESRQELEQQRRLERLYADLQSDDQAARLAALRSLDVMAKVNPQLIKPAEEDIIKLLESLQGKPEEWQMTIGLLGSIGGHKALTGLSRFLERLQLREETDFNRVTVVLQSLTMASKMLQQIQQDGFVGSEDAPLCLGVPSATTSADSSAVSTSLLRFEVLPSSPQMGAVCAMPRGIKTVFFEMLAPDTFLTMVEIPAGSFAMGSPWGEKQLNEYDGPQHEVLLEEFFISQTPITQAQWRVVAGWKEEKHDLKPDPSEFKGCNRPVEGVNWLDAVEFCRRLSIRTGRSYGLPSEAQWEYACRAGTTTRFHFGETINATLANYNAAFSYRGSPRGEVRRQTTEVGHFPANAWGLYDMHGNVREWCQDDWHGSYDGAPGDGSPWVEDGEINDIKVMRGGSWFSTPEECRSGHRANNHGGIGSYTEGFRVCCFLPGPS